MVDLLVIFGMNWLINIMKCLSLNVNFVSGDKDNVKKKEYFRSVVRA